MQKVQNLGSLALLVALVVSASYGCSDDGGASKDGPSSSSSSSGAVSSGASSSSSGSSGASSGNGSSSSSGAPEDAGAGLPQACEDACRALTLRIDKGEASGTFSRVQFGFNRDGTLHVEAHEGGNAACPTASSPDPDYTLVMGLPVPVDVTPVSKAGGFSASFLDLQGDIEEFPPPPSLEATLTPVAGRLDAGEERFFAFDAAITFEGGATVSGHAFAEHCDTLDEP